MSSSRRVPGARRPTLWVPIALVAALLGPACASLPGPAAPQSLSSSGHTSSPFTRSSAASPFAPPSPPSSARSTPSTVTSAAAPPPVSSGELCVERILARLTPSQRAAQVLMLGVPVDSARAAVPTIRSYHPGGVFLRGRSRRSAAEVRAQVRALQGALGRDPLVPLHVAVDQEGGRVQTLRGPWVGRMPSAVVQGRWSTATLEARTARWAAALRDVGVTMNFAPVADTVAAVDVRRNPPIGAVDRHYGTRPGAVAEDVAAVTRAAQSAGVVATVKHFPGLGRVRANTDVSRRAIDPVMAPDDPHLRPFRAGIAAGAGAVMMSSARYPKLDPDRPAVFSPRIVGMLRRDLGFTGLIVSDDLGSAVAVRRVPIGRRAVAFIAAGGDLVLTVRQQDAAPMGSALLAEAARSAEFRLRLDDAVRHVLLSKQRAGMLACA